MSYVKPDAVVENMVQVGTAKAHLAPKDLLIRGFLSGGILGFATTLAMTAAAQSGMKYIGAILFPIGFVMIVLLGLELVTGNFALLPAALVDRKIGAGKMLSNWGWVFLGNLLGSLAYAWMFVFVQPPDAPIVKGLVDLAQAKTLAYEKMGMHGMMVVFIKAILCNWMVTLGVAMAMTSTSTTGKILAAWLPILTFFAQGFEHSVVNMFAIPAGMMLGAPVSVSQWWVWNQLPVTLGNLVGGALFTGLALLVTHQKKAIVSSENTAKETFVPDALAA